MDFKWNKEDNLKYMGYKITDQNAWQNSDSNIRRNMLSGICPFCNQSSGFKINGYKGNGTIPLKCDNCKKNVIWYAKPNSLNGLPEDIDKYYQEALNCIVAPSPNGAATLFRKIIHQVGIHYKVAKINDGACLMGIVEKLEKDGHINKKLVEALRRVKDLGNDGAHVNQFSFRSRKIYMLKRIENTRRGQGFY